jgi:predicted transcriptional regulator YdeE
MEYKTVTLPAFLVAGIKIKTSNEEAALTIMPHWQKFFSEKVQERIPNKTDNDVIALYHEYEGDHTKPYSLTIGCRVSSAENLPEGVVSAEVPAAKYAVFSPHGKMPDIVFNTWTHVWESGLERAYSGDFEIYGERSSDPADAELDIYIAIKE